MVGASEIMGKSFEDMMSPVVSVPKGLSEVARAPMEAAKQQMMDISDGIIDGFSDLSQSIRTAGMYIGIGTCKPHIIIAAYAHLHSFASVSFEKSPAWLATLQIV